jgi:2-keto-3-deoxy-L-rhamnonate aldolase RhmA
MANFRSRVKSREPVFGTLVVEFRAPAISQILASAGFDFLIIDMEHGSFDMHLVADMIQVARLSNIVPLVRPPSLTPHFLTKALDAGAIGLMLPHVETSSDVMSIVEAVRYPPEGKRGCSLGRAQTDYQSVKLASFIEKMNRETFLLIQIESRLGVENLDDILKVPGVDGILIGPTDLSIDLGIPDQLSNDLFVSTVKKIFAACEAHGIAPGIHANQIEFADYWMKSGAKIITYSSDYGFLAGSSRKAMEELKALNPGRLAE